MRLQTLKQRATWVDAASSDSCAARIDPPSELHGFVEYCLIIPFLLHHKWPSKLFSVAFCTMSEDGRLIWDA